MELAEISQLVRSETETIKAFLSRSVDRYRPPYGRGVVEVPRQCVLIGTTNASDYLRDATGNRRFWPAECRSAGRADLDWLAANREQLWAEAARREADGESVWLDSAEVEDAAAAAQRSSMSDDPWSDRVLTFVQNRTAITVAEVLEEALLITLSHQDKRAQMRVASILQVAGWTKKDVWNAAIHRVVKRWLRPEEVAR